MPGEERRQQRHDAPDAIFGRQGDAQHAGKTIGAARRALRLVDREQGVAGASEQRLAGVGGGNLPGGADEELDAQAALERRDGARHRGLGETEFARGLGEASALDRAYEQGELLQPIIHAGDEYIISLLALYLSPPALLTSWPSKASGANSGARRRDKEHGNGRTQRESGDRYWSVEGHWRGDRAPLRRGGGGGGRQLCVGQGRRRSGRREISGDGGKAVAIQANVSKSADVKRLFAETKAKLGAPSILVNNAGVFTFQPLEAVTEEEFHRQFDTNVLGTLLATREAVAAFDGAGGSVINLSTIASVNPVPNSVIYSSSKAAVDTITRALALELAPKKIRVNAIAPGATETEGTKTMGLTMETAKAMGMVMPMGRMGQPDDIARVALFLASDQSSWLTGERISASGGQR